MTGRPGMTLARLALVTCLLAGGVPSSEAMETPPGPPVTLIGRLGLIMIEDPSQPLPPETDGAWRTALLGPDGLDRPLSHREGTAWVRFRFSLPEIPRFRDPAILITHPADAEEPFLNGHPLGGRGVIGVDFQPVPAEPRLLSIPVPALRSGENELVMRVLLAGRNVRVFDGPIRLGEHSSVALEWQELLKPVIVTESAFLSMFFFLLVFYGLLIVKGAIRSDYLLFTLFTASYALAFLLGSNLFFLNVVEAGWTTRLETAITSFLVPIMITLVTTLTGGRLGWAYYTLMTAGVVFAGLEILLPPLTALQALAVPRLAFLVIVGGYYLFLSIRAVAQRRLESWAVLLGVTVYVVGSRVELFWGLRMQDYAMGFFAVCMLYTITSRHARLKNRLVAVSTSLLDAHEQERSRISRDIHDGIGQYLQTLKLRLQMLSSRLREGVPVSPDGLDILAGDTSWIIEEVRRISTDLRPSYLESTGLAEAVAAYAQSLAERRQIDIRFHRGVFPFPDPPARVKDNLYRIYQEMLMNAVKHSHASRIDVSLYHTDTAIVLQVADNGRGFELSEAELAGIGLSTMRERAELLGGTCSIESKAGRGTVLTAEVPLS
jgi:signal transduction histidine kinase